MKGPRSVRLLWPFLRRDRYQEVEGDFLEGELGWPEALRSLPALAAAMWRSGEMPVWMAVGLLCGAVPLGLVDRLWRFVYSMIPLKEDLIRPAEVWAMHLVAMVVAGAAAGMGLREGRAIFWIALAAAAGGWWTMTALPVSPPPWFMLAHPLLGAAALRLGRCVRTKTEEERNSMQ